MKKVDIYIAAAIVCGCFAVAASADETGFQGGYYGGKLGVNHSEVTGAINAPGESTLAYMVQGGYIQGGYNKKYGMSLVGIGGYADLHGYERHLDGIAYGGHAYGLDVKLAIPVDDWLPYVKLGYGYSAGTGDLRTIKQFGFNKTIGAEYKLDTHWSAVAEYKFNTFGKDSITIKNQTFMFGFNYYPEKPMVAASEPEIDLTQPVPEAAPDVPPEFAPPP